MRPLRQPTEEDHWAAPVHAVDEVVTASRTNTWFINCLFAYETATESVVPSTTLQDDDHLTVTVEANAVYDVTIVLTCDGTGGGDLNRRLKGRPVRGSAVWRSD